jgi:hypothetical protein
MRTWDTDSIFKRLGGNPGVIALCVRYAPDTVPPRPRTIDLWRFRHRISAPWLPVIVHGWLAEGLPVEELFVRDQPRRRAPARSQPDAA